MNRTQIIEAFVKLARGTLDADGIAQLREQLSPEPQSRPVTHVETAPLTYAEIKAGGFIG